MATGLTAFSTRLLSILRSALVVYTLTYHSVLKSTLWLCLPGWWAIFWEFLSTSIPSMFLELAQLVLAAISALLLYLSLHLPSFATRHRAAQTLSMHIHTSPCRFLWRHKIFFVHGPCNPSV